MPGHRALSLEGGLTLNSLPLDEASYLDIPIETSELDLWHPDRSLTFVVLFYAAGGVLLVQSGGRPWTWDPGDQDGWARGEERGPSTMCLGMESPVLSYQLWGP